MVEVRPGFQPAGRAPAPPPLDLVQDFVNTEITVWAVDGIATPDALGDWLRSRELITDMTRVDASSFVRARALRRVLRELASRNTHGVLPEVELRAEFATIAAELADLAHDTGTTVVCATHDPLLIGLADREVRLREMSPVRSP